MMAYADEIVCLLSSPADLDLLHSHLQVHPTASNALVNFHKTEAISLSVAVSNYVLIWRIPLLQHRITSWCHVVLAHQISWLSIAHIGQQRNSFLDQL
ncbi:hypothetical protein V8B55DRAFT_1551976, partial [Mucor lusitanicus]